MRAFIIMPFNGEFEDIYQKFIAEALDETEVYYERADDIRSQENILKSIIQGIANADFIIADLTHSNPNVYYELGIAHSFRKPVILLTQNISDLPFDLKSYRVIDYSTNFAKIREAKSDLIQTIEEFKQDNITFGNPVTDFLSKESKYKDNKIKSKHDEFQLGFLDHIVEINKSFSNLNEIALDIADSTTHIAHETTEATKKLKRANSDKSQAVTFRIQRIVQSLADEFIDYADTLEESNIKYAEINIRVKSSLSYVYNYLTKEEIDVEEEAIKEQQKSITDLKRSIILAKKSVGNYKETLENLPDFQKDLNNSIKATIKNQDELINNLEQTLATLDRTDRLIDQVLEKV